MDLFQVTCSILNSPELLDMINQKSKLVSVIGYIESKCLSSKEDRKKRAMETYYHSNNKSEQNQMRDYDNMLKGLKNFEFLVHPVWSFGMD